MPPCNTIITRFRPTYNTCINPILLINRYYWDSSCHSLFGTDISVGRLISCGFNPEFNLDPEIPEIPEFPELNFTIPGLPPILPIITSGSQQSNATIVWDIPADQTPGIYRITHYGTSKASPPGPIGQPSFTPYTGTSRVFEVVEGVGGTGGRYVHPTETTPPPPLSGDVFRDHLGPLWDEAGVGAPRIDYENLYA